MKKTQRLAAIGALGVLTLSIAACSNGEEASTASTTQAPSTSDVATTTPEATTEAPTSTTAAEESSDGVTQVSDIFGPACNQVPTSGPGSAEGMVDAAVGTAASNNPLFKTLTAGVKAAGLVDTLNDTSAAYTVFGPVDSAFEKLPAGTLDTLLADPKGQLTTILTYHVIPKRYGRRGPGRGGLGHVGPGWRCHGHGYRRRADDQRQPGAVRQHPHRQRHRVRHRLGAHAPGLISVDRAPRPTRGRGARRCAPDPAGGA